jgi:bacillithiol system protein YtxJ
MFGLRFRHAFPELLTLEDLDRTLESTETAPLLIYKHSLTCGTSAFALEQLTRLTSSDTSLPIHLVPVQKARAVSDAIADRLDLRHESPQLILVDKGTVRWHASHFRVTADRVRDALQELGLAPQS